MTDYRQQKPKGNDSVPTNPELWRPLARAVGGFDVDPAAGCEPEAIASERYTVEDDGLSQPWYGTVWLNPPFSDKTVWYRRLVDQYRNGDVDRAVAIAPVDTSTEWFQRWFSTADKLGFLSGRDWYLSTSPDTGSPSYSTVVGIWNPTDDARAVLKRLGTVVTPERDTEQMRLGK